MKDIQKAFEQMLAKRPDIRKTLEEGNTVVVFESENTLRIPSYDDAQGSWDGITITRDGFTYRATRDDGKWWVSIHMAWVLDKAMEV